MTEYKILRAIEDNGGYIAYEDLMNYDKDDPNWNPIATRDAIRLMIEKELLDGLTRSGGVIRFGRYGLLRLQHLKYRSQQIVQNAAKKTKEERLQRKRRVLYDIFLIFLGALITFIAERTPEIIEFVVSLFR